MRRGFYLKYISGAQHLKKTFILLISFLILIQSYSNAKGNKEAEMKKKAEELSYAGQLEKANELLGKESELPSEKASEGWDTTSLTLSMIWGSLGAGYFIYGKRQSKAVFLLCGIGLCVFPMFVSGNTLSLILGLGMTIAPFKLDF